MRSRHAQPRGFTMVEAALSVAVVGVLMVASTNVFSTIARSRGQQAEKRLATLLAGHLMAEIMAEPFSQAGTPAPFGPQPGMTRATFTAVDCYDGYAASPPADSSGNALSDYAGWSQGVSVTFASVAAPQTAATTSTLKKITVTITAPSKKVYTLVGWRSKYGAYEAITASGTYVTGVGVALQGAAPGKTTYVGTHPLNGTGQ